jgi:TatD DNase family protein
MDELHLEKVTDEYVIAGIHPWWLEDFTEGEIEKSKTHIESMIAAKKLWAVGETGIDRAYPETLEIQKKLFRWHFQLSETNQLPLVIHNVRSGSDFLEFMKANRPTQPWIFHDFRGNEDLLKKLLGMHPDCYFSFGLSIDNSQSVRELLPFVPLSNLFLETDDQKHLDIHDIHLRASEKIGIDPEFLKAQLWLNFRKITPKHLFS